MFSKSKINIAMAATLAFTSVGCSDFLNGKKAEPQVMELSDARFKCLQSLPNQLQKFSVGDAQEKDIRDGSDCMIEALLYFNKRTFGSLPNAYTVEEMRKFFGKYFLKENNVTPQFAAELMKIKQALLGGATTYITKEEIIRLVEILKVVREEAVQLAPHVKILLNQKTQKTAEWEQITLATDQLRLALQRLLDKTQIAKSEYSFEDAKKALAGFSEFIRGETPFAPYDQYGEWIPVVESVKNILMGERAQFTSKLQWSESLDTLINLYELALKYHYSLSDLKFEDRSKLRQVSQFLGQSLQLIQNSHGLKTTGRITIKDIDNLIEQLTAKFPSSISGKALKKTYRAVLIKVLDPERKSDTRDLQGLERKHLATIAREFNIWRLHQSFVDSLQYDEMGGGYTQSELYQAYTKFNRSFVIEKGLVDDAFEQKALELAWQDYGEILKKETPVSFNEQGRLIIARDAKNMKQTWKSLTKANFVRALARLLTLGWGDNTKGRMTSASISQPGLISWYDDFQEIGRDLKAFDPRSANSGGRSFLEANFFTFSGNGDQAMDQSETYEFVSTLVAAGLSSSQAVQDHMGLAGCLIEEKDVFGNAFIKEECFKSQIRKHFDLYFNNLPGMVQYVRSLSTADWEQFYRHLAVASEAPSQKRGYVETANIRTMVTILHYIEGLMVMYDADGSSTLSLDEIYAATPRFMSFFKTVTDTKSETLLEEGFAYLVFRGSIPGAGGLARFQWDKMWGIDDARRMEIVRIFGTLKDQLNKPKN
ncbi:hypothetical protein ACLWBD_10595 [Bdellovibrio sp. HCB117]|uniref:hypothetical protein n=1 Tax=Bdellovibrio sp. HCB117 TaxID=3394359 RepID=UPI0039B41F5B